METNNGFGELNRGCERQAEIRKKKERIQKKNKKKYFFKFYCQVCGSLFDTQNAIVIKRIETAHYCFLE